MRVRIDVTARDIKLGVRRDTALCPVARACSRVLSCFRGAYDTIWGQDYEVDTPPRVYRFIGRFDAGHPVKPIRFTINVPAKFVKPAKRKA